MTDDADAAGNGPVTPEDLAAARERWADPAHEPSIRDLFARPVAGGGIRGDVLADPNANPEPTRGNDD